jgi:hypothetical protein
MFVKDLKFGNGLGFFKETQIYLFPANYVLACFKLGYNNTRPEIWKKYLREFSFDDCYILYDKFKNLSEKQIFDFFLDYIKYFGFGEVKLVHKSKKKLIFTLVNDSYTNYYQKLYGENLEVSFDEIMAGFLENYFSLVYGKKLNCEISFFSNGVNFELEITNEVFTLISEKIYPKFESGNVSLSLKKLLLNKAITFDTGVILISNTKAFFVPYHFFLNFLNFISKSNSLIEIIYSLGYVQGRAAYSLHRYLGMKEGEEVFNSVMSIYDLSGIGLIEYVHGDYLNINIKNNIKFYSTFYENSILKIFNNQIINMYKGNYDFSFDKYTNIINKSLNIAELKFISDFNRIDKIKNELYKYLTTKVLYTDKK